MPAAWARSPQQLSNWGALPAAAAAAAATAVACAGVLAVLGMAVWRVASAASHDLPGPPRCAACRYSDERLLLPLLDTVVGKLPQLSPKAVVELVSRESDALAGSPAGWHACRVPRLAAWLPLGPRQVAIALPPHIIFPAGLPWSCQVQLSLLFLLPQPHTTCPAAGGPGRPWVRAQGGAGCSDGAGGRVLTSLPLCELGALPAAG